MKYLVDNMFNGLTKELPKMDVDCETVIHAIWNDDDSSKPERWDAKIFRFLLEKKYDLVPREESDRHSIITADNDLARYCGEFGLDCIHVPQAKPITKAEFHELATKLETRLEKKSSSA